MAYISLEHVVKRYQMGEVVITAVRDISFEIERGEFCIIVGPSGAGKTTVLNILGGMDECDEGTILVDGQKVSDYSQKELTTYRRYDIGFVFQFYNLVQNLTALENVELAAQICRNPLDAVDVLKHVGLAERMDNFPGQLSGGEQQRVAIARALAKKPQAAAVRRAHRRIGLRHRQADSQAAPGHLPQAGHDRGGHHPQYRPHPHGRPGHPHQERYRGRRGAHRSPHARGGD